MSPISDNAIQRDYSERIDKPRAGTIKGSNFQTKTGNCEVALGLAFGVPVSQGVGDIGLLLAGAIGAFLGVTTRDIALGAEQDRYNQYQNVGYLTQGEIWVVASVAVSPADPVHFNATTGAWLITGGTGPIVGARWRTTAAPGEVAVLELQAK